MTEPESHREKRRRVDEIGIPSTEPSPLNGLSALANAWIEPACSDLYLQSYYNLPGGHFREIQPFLPVTSENQTVGTTWSHNWESFTLNAHDEPGKLFLHGIHYNGYGFPLWMDATRNAANGDEMLEVNGSNETSSECVCFGMILEVPGRCESKGLKNLQPHFAVNLSQLSSTNDFNAIDEPSVVGRILGSHSHITQGLLQESTLKLYASCDIEEDAHIGESSYPSVLVPCTVNITLYGPFELFDEIGSWCQDYEVYLQDPLETHLDVRYCNPHKLTTEAVNSCPMLSEVVSRPKGLHLLQKLVGQTNFLDSLTTDIELAEAPQPPNIRTVLKRHQKQALTFMLERERGWNFKSQRPEIWQSADTDDGRLFFNTISGSFQHDAPTQFYGGIVADSMGLGKTLSMISLIAQDRLTGKLNNFTGAWSNERPVVSATLIVVPPPLLGTWEQQFFEHVVQDELHILRHHSKSKLSKLEELNSAAVVLTTYHTVSSDWKSRASGRVSLLYSVNWRRIVLDEAHMIRDAKSRMAQAICALHSSSRWAVTGTPIQNRLGDLTTLLTFIRAYPYDNPKVFESDVAGLWKTGKDAEAVQRLQHLAACLLLRRPKTTINLPARHDTRCAVRFNKKERAAYEQMKNRVVQRLDDILQDTGPSVAAGYVNALQQIESLRLFCNLGLHYQSRDGNNCQLPVETQGWAQAAQHAFDTQRAMAAIECISCKLTLNINDMVLDDTSLKLQNSRLNMACGHTPPCPAAAVSTSTDILEEIPELNMSSAQNRSAGYPPKIKALVADLQAVPNDVKCIVFSSWRSTLDMVESAMNDISMKCIRFDGKVPQRDRQNVMLRFNNDPSIRLMLLTYTCGAVGLTLTSASRAYLVEPHWNPTIEEQALARIHRIGQAREVTTIRFYIEGSFEEQIFKVQESKKELAAIILSQHEGQKAESGLGSLERLRSLL